VHCGGLHFEVHKVIPEQRHSGCGNSLGRIGDEFNCGQSGNHNAVTSLDCKEHFGGDGDWNAGVDCSQGGVKQVGGLDCVQVCMDERDNIFQENRSNSGSNRKSNNKQTMKKLLSVVALLGLAISLQAQTIDTNHPPQPGDVLTNVPKGISAVVDFGLGLLPYWDKNLTNSFNANEFVILSGPAWKSATANGSTPYLDLGAEYYFARNFGAGVDVVTFGNGKGSSDIDSAHLDLIGRKDVGNVAGFVLLGGGRDFGINRYDFEAGGGLEFRYSTAVGMRVDTRYIKLFDKFKNLTSSTDHEFLTRVVLDIHF
jgi:hypothetical protein